MAPFGVSFVFVGVRTCHPTSSSSARARSVSQIKILNLLEVKNSASDDIDNDDNGDEDSSFNFMASLSSRIAEVKNQDTSCPLVVLDCMLPRQVLRVRVNDPQVVKVVRRQLGNETPTFGMRGTMRLKEDSNIPSGDGGILKAGQEVKLKNGVEVEIMQPPQFIEEGVLLMLRAKRRFKVLSEVENKEQGWIDANVKYLDSKEQEEEELDTSRDPMCIQRATLKAAELTPLIDQWIELARQCEKRPGQIDMLLADIGHIPPPSTEPSERAFWVGALINPLPEMGVATGVRPELITAETALERVDIAYDGILRSIAHMDGSDPLW